MSRVEVLAPTAHRPTSSPYLQAYSEARSSFPSHEFCHSLSKTAWYPLRPILTASPSLSAIKRIIGVGLRGVELPLFLLFEFHGPDNGSQEGKAFCWVGGQALAKKSLSCYLIASSAWFILSGRTMDTQKKGGWHVQGCRRQLLRVDRNVSREDHRIHYMAASCACHGVLLVILLVTTPGTLWYLGAIPL